MEGGVDVVQIQNADPESGIDWASLTKAHLPGRRKPDWLRDGDILFANKGYWHKAVLVSGAPAQSVCVPLFFHLRIVQPDLVRPGYLVWCINNNTHIQRYINERALGSGTRAVRREDIESLQVWLPRMDLQDQVMGMQAVVEEEARVLAALADNRKKEFAYIAGRIMHGVIQ